MSKPTQAALPLFKDNDRLHGYVTIAPLASTAGPSYAQSVKVADILADIGFDIFMTTGTKVHFNTSAAAFERELGVGRPDPNADFSEIAKPRDPRLAGLINEVKVEALTKARARTRGPA